MLNAENRSKIIKILPYLVLAGLAALFLMRAFIGFDWSDETYYLALPYRLVLGDRMFVDSWDIHQTGALLMAPILWLYRHLVGDMTGVILFTRLLFVVFQTFVSFVIYRTVLVCWRSRFPALLCASLCLSFVPFSISNFSYNTMGYLFAVLASMLLLRLYQGPSFVQAAVLGGLSGICFACSCIAYPFFATAALPFSALLLGIRPVLNVKNGGDRLSFAPFFFVLAGGTLTAGAAFFYAVSTAGLHGIFDNLIYLFADPEHPYVSVWTKSSLFLKDYYHLAAFMLLQVCLLILILLCRLIDVGFNLDPIFQFTVKVCAPLCILLDIVLILIQPEEVAPATAKVNFIQGCTGIWPLVLCAYKPSRRGVIVLFSLYFPAVFMCWAIYAASNNGITGASYVLVMAVIATVLILYDYYKAREKEEDNPNRLNLLKTVQGFMLLVAIGLVACNTGLRLNTVYRDAPLSFLHSSIQIGPAKGIRTTTSSAAAYHGIVADIQKAQAELPQGSRIMFHELLPFGYLCGEYAPAPPSLWRTRLPSDRVNEYFEMKPENRPALLYSIKTSYGLNAGSNILTEEEAEKILGGPVTIKETEYSYQFFIE